MIRSRRGIAGRGELLAVRLVINANRQGAATAVGRRGSRATRAVARRLVRVAQDAAIPEP